GDLERTLPVQGAVVTLEVPVDLDLTVFDDGLEIDAVAVLDGGVEAVRRRSVSGDVRRLGRCRGAGRDHHQSDDDGHDESDDADVKQVDAFHDGLLSRNLE